MDRSKICPLLLRIFYKLNGHNELEDFLPPSTPEHELQAFVWPDTCLRELAELLKDVVEEAKGKNAKLKFRLVYFDNTGTPRAADLGIISNTTRGYVDTRTLSLLKFQTGDFIDVAIYNYTS